MLNLCNLKENYHLLIEYMKEGDYKYGDRYIGYIFSEIKKLINSEEYFDSYEDYYLYRINDCNLSKSSIKNIKSMINIIMNFDLYGIFPNGTYMQHQLFENEKLALLSSEFINILETYKQMMDYSKKCETTYCSEFSIMKSFLENMQERNIMTLSDIKESDVISYFMTDDNEIIRGYGTRFILKRALHTVSYHFDECNRIVNYIPELKEHRKNIQYLTDDEISILKDVIINGHENVSYKGRAILSLLLYPALRAVDIAAIKLCDIDWDKEIIYIKQSKTKNPYYIPLIPVIGNQLSNYILNERPYNSKSAHLFVLDRFIDREMKSQSVRDYVNNIMKTIGIRCNAGDRKGTHIFRHHLASAMIENEIPAPIVSASMGHSSPESLEDYLKTDFKHLKSCSLSIEKFPFCGYKEGGEDDGVE